MRKRIVYYIVFAVAFVISVSLCGMYVFHYISSVQQMANSHLYYKEGGPTNWIIFSVLLFLEVLHLRKRQIPLFYFVIPIVFFLCGVITLIVALNTRCIPCSTLG